MTDRPTVKDVKDAGDATLAIALHLARPISELGNIRRATIVMEDADPDTPDVQFDLVFDGDEVDANVRRSVIPLDQLQTPHEGPHYQAGDTIGQSGEGGSES